MRGNPWVRWKNSDLHEICLFFILYLFFHIVFYEHLMFLVSITTPGWVFCDLKPNKQKLCSSSFSTHWFLALVHLFGSKHHVISGGRQWIFWLAFTCVVKGTDSGIRCESKSWFLPALLCEFEQVTPLCLPCLICKTGMMMATYSRRSVGDYLS